MRVLAGMAPTMRQRIAGCAPDMVTYSVASQRLREVWRVVAGIGLANRMRLISLDPNAATCSVAVNACEKGGVAQHALHLVINCRDLGDKHDLLQRHRDAEVSISGDAFKFSAVVLLNVANTNRTLKKLFKLFFVFLWQKMFGISRPFLFIFILFTAQFNYKLIKAWMLRTVETQDGRQHRRIQ